MLLPDINILIYAQRADGPEHERYATLAARIDSFVGSVCAVGGCARRLLADRDEPADLRSANAYGHRYPVLSEAGGAAPRSHDRSRPTALGHLCRVVPEDRRAARDGRIPGGSGHRTCVRVGFHRQRFRPFSGAAVATSTRAVRLRNADGLAGLRRFLLCWSGVRTDDVVWAGTACGGLGPAPSPRRP